MTGNRRPGPGHRADLDPLGVVVSTAVTASTLLLAFGLLAVGVDSFWIVFPVGFGGVVPLSLGLVAYSTTQSGSERTPTDRTEAEDALDALRQRYARGELTDEEFENRVEALLETEAIN